MVIELLPPEQSSLLDEADAFDDKACSEEENEEEGEEEEEDEPEWLRQASVTLKHESIASMAIQADDPTRWPVDDPAKWWWLAISAPFAGAVQAVQGVSMGLGDNIKAVSEILTPLPNNGIPV